MADQVIEEKRGKRKTLTREDFSNGLKIIWRYLRPHQRELFSLIALSLVAGAAEAFVPLLGGRVFDALIGLAADPAASLRAIFFIILGWFGLKMVTDFADWRIGIGEERLGTIVQGEYFAAGFAHLFRLPIAFHRDAQQGEVGDRINRAAHWLSNISESVIINLLPRFLSVIVALTIAFFIYPWLAFILVLGVAIFITVLAGSVGELTFLQRRMQAAYNRSYGIAYDALGNVLEMKQATAENFEARRIHRRFVGLTSRLFLDMQRVFKRLNLAQRLLISATQLAIFLFSVFLVRRGAITPGELVAFNGYAAMLFGPFAVLGNNWNTIQNGIVAINRAEKVLALAEETYVPENAVIVSELRGEVAFEGVTFAHRPGQPILRDISFTVRPGEVVALVGESGVGKTTLVELLLGLFWPQGGKILIDGHDLRALDLRAYRQKIAVVPQEPSLFNDTAAFNIRYGNFGASDLEVRRAAADAHAAEFIEVFPKRYEQRVGWRGVKLSTGQKQRIAVARALLRNPRILILDEPTSALDAKTEQLLEDSFERLMSGRTTFIIAHRLRTVRRADKIVVLDKGTIADSGTHEELIARGGIYRHLYELQFSKKRDGE